MHDFKIFQQIFKFFVDSKLNPDYVSRIDSQISSNEASPELKSLISEVKSFHGMRQQLCGRIFEHLHNHPILHEFIQSSRVEQHDTAARKSTCAFTNQTMAQNQGMTLIVGTKNIHIVTIHKRFKRLLYNFWYLVHFTDEILKEIYVWLKLQRWWTRGTCNDVSDRIMKHQDGMFAKQAYVKLKNISQYIQEELVSLPINH